MIILGMLLLVANTLTVAYALTHGDPVATIMGAVGMFFSILIIGADD